MKKLIVVLAVVALAGAASADILAGFAAGFGIYGNGDNGGLVDNVAGTEVVLQLIGGGGDGLDYSFCNPFLISGNDVLIGSLSTFISGTGDFGDYAATLTGVISAPWQGDTWITVSGVNAGDWVYTTSVVLDDLGPLDPPQIIFFDNGGAGVLPGELDGSVIICPEPATGGLMVLISGGIFFTRRIFVI